MRTIVFVSNEGKPCRLAHMDSRCEINSAALILDLAVRKTSKSILLCDNKICRDRDPQKERLVARLS